MQGCCSAFSTLSYVFLVLRPTSWLQQRFSASLLCTKSVPSAWGQCAVFVVQLRSLKLDMCLEPLCQVSGVVFSPSICCFYWSQTWRHQHQHATRDASLLLLCCARPTSSHHRAACFVPALAAATPAGLPCLAAISTAGTAHRRPLLLQLHGAAAGPAAG